MGRKMKVVDSNKKHLTKAEKEYLDEEDFGAYDIDNDCLYEDDDK